MRCHAVRHNCLPSRLRRLFHIAVLIGISWLSACADNSPENREPVPVVMHIRTSASVNPDSHRRAAPVVMRLYELKSDRAFRSADFFALQDKDRITLGDDLLSRDEWLLRPGEDLTVKRTVNLETISLGFIAAYRDLSASKWRTVTVLPNTPTATWFDRSIPLVLIVELGQNSIQVNVVNP